MARKGENKRNARAPMRLIDPLLRCSTIDTKMGKATPYLTGKLEGDKSMAEERLSEIST